MELRPAGSITFALVEERELPADTRWLGPSERAAIERPMAEARRRSFLLGRWAARRALSSLVGDGEALPAMEVVAAPDGAPEVRLAGAALPYALSLSHSEGRAVCALSTVPMALGADVESIAPRGPGLAEDFFTETERAALSTVPEALLPLATNLVWSAKESALKALREGLRRDTRDIEVELPRLDEQPDSETTAWRPLSARSTCGRAFTGWWRRDRDSVLTLLADHPISAPAIQ